MSELLKKRVVEAIGHALAGKGSYYYSTRCSPKLVLWDLRSNNFAIKWMRLINANNRLVRWPNQWHYHLSTRCDIDEVIIIKIKLRDLSAVSECKHRARRAITSPMLAWSMHCASLCAMRACSDYTRKSLSDVRSHSSFLS